MNRRSEIERPPPGAVRKLIKLVEVKRERKREHESSNQDPDTCAQRRAIGDRSTNPELLVLGILVSGGVNQDAGTAKPSDSLVRYFGSGLVAVAIHP